MVREPHAVGGEMEHVAVRVHAAGQNLQDNRLAMTPTDFAGRGQVRREMDVVPAAPMQAGGVGWRRFCRPPGPLPGPYPP